MLATSAPTQAAAGIPTAQTIHAGNSPHGGDGGSLPAAEEPSSNEMQLNAKPNPAKAGQSVTLTATVPRSIGEDNDAPDTGSGDPSDGTVTFYVNGNEREAPVANGKASTSVTLPAGTYSARAAYDGGELCGECSNSSTEFKVTPAASHTPVSAHGHAHVPGRVPQSPPSPVLPVTG
jgi:hypothetical protein